MTESQRGGVSNSRKANRDQSQAPPLRASSIWLYGSLGFPLAMLGYPLGVWLPRAYATDVGLSLAGSVA